MNTKPRPTRRKGKISTAQQLGAVGALLAVLAAGVWFALLSTRGQDSPPPPTDYSAAWALVRPTDKVAFDAAVDEYGRLGGIDAFEFYNALTAGGYNCTDPLGRIINRGQAGEYVCADEDAWYGYFYTQAEETGEDGAVASRMILYGWKIVFPANELVWNKLAASGAEAFLGADFEAVDKEVRRCINASQCDFHPILDGFAHIATINDKVLDKMVVLQFGGTAFGVADVYGIYEITAIAPPAVLIPVQLNAPDAEQPASPSGGGNDTGDEK